MKKALSVTAYDVAQLARVSQATVSRVFSATSVVKSETKDRVEAAAALLGYTPNAIARGLTSHKTGIIAVVSISSGNPYFSMIISKFYAKFQEAGEQILYFEVEAELELDRLLYKILQYQVDGIVIISAAVTSSSASMVTRVNTPIVVFNKTVSSKEVYVVCSDNVEAGRSVANYFLDRGKKRIACIGSDRFQGTSAGRARGFTERMQERGYELISFQLGDHSYDSGRLAIKKMISENINPDAVFCVNDLMAFGAVDALRKELGLRVPEDVAVIGFDDIEPSSWKGYDLTTVHQPIDEMVEASYQYLSKRIDGEPIEPTLQLFNCSIVERGTV